MTAPVHSEPLASAAKAFVGPRAPLYLDFASHGTRLRAVHAAARRELGSVATSWFGPDWREHVENVRALAAQLFDGDADSIAFVPSAAYGLSVAARNLPLRSGEAILVLDGEFPSNVLPWQQRCDEVGAQLIRVQRDPDADWTQAVLRALEAEPSVVTLALPQVHWQDGSWLDLAAIGARARERGARLVLDLSQSLGALPVDLEAWKPEFAVAVGYKWMLGPAGLAYLWAAPGWRDAGVGLEQGWMAYDTDALWSSPWSRTRSMRLPGARRFDANAVCDVLRLSMAEAGLTQVLAWGISDIGKALCVRVDAFARALQARGLGAWLPPGKVMHFCALTPPADILNRLASGLREDGVAFGLRQGRLRISPHLNISVPQLTSLARRLADLALGPTDQGELARSSPNTIIRINRSGTRAR